MSDELPVITAEFLSSELDRTRQFSEKSKKGGPYSRLERINRKRNVFELHFEQGYSAIKIAKMIKVNRHTVTKDISFWYDQLAEEVGVDETNLILKHTYRLETQRTRFLEQLKTQNGFHQQIILEKMILDIDCKIAYMKLKSITTKEHIIKSVIDLVDGIVSKPGELSHWINTAAIYKVSKATQKKVMKIINDDQKNHADYTLEEENQEL